MLAGAAATCYCGGASVRWAAMCNCAVGSNTRIRYFWCLVKAGTISGRNLGTLCQGLQLVGCAAAAAEMAVEQAGVSVPGLCGNNIGHDIHLIIMAIRWP